MNNNQKQNIYVLYHENCMDGKGAAYAAWKALGDNENTFYIPVQYGKPIPLLQDNSIVYIVDFSYKRDQILSLKERMSKVVVLDHHKTAQTELENIEDAYFDMNHSGCTLTWAYFHTKPDEALNKVVSFPKVLLSIEDRDLWKFQYPETKFVSKALELLIKDFRELETYSQDEVAYRSLVAIGQQKDFFDQKAIESSIYKASISYVDNMKIAFSNTTGLISDIGHELCKKLDVDFSMTYFFTNDGKVVFSLRSIGDKFDVSEYAKTLGGGGHQNASGVSCNLEKGFELIEALFENSKTVTQEDIKI
jgi:oligoribonuclease NrnB/cAMP/cGMP phosphodiesterase (DHH superfamily)